MPTTTLPDPKAIKDLLEGMLGRDVDVAIGNPVAPTDCAAMGIFHTDLGQLSAVVMTDLPLGAFLGASIALIPVGGAEASVEDGVLAQNLFDNVAEVFNVFASVLNEHSDEHQRLVGTSPGVVGAPGDAAELAGHPANRLDLTVSVAKYGTGHWSVVLV
ncbi:hypothetical protein SAMN05443575_1908 [Jatrophihabitans endophyticus]|uniref:Chemotaxis phosphatase CheX-like domain-containing protein n=1 Tax=Jatrophihabitans endophyticus TaxID=1206085 RepID=A0A1M5IIL4_9ACTN|nr:hypothetical protein [Jatrophihabitans endophyticus]SHG28188.1 hypothetical protein SAMN05443575_1908 [Jatrophihabitans endophyticus]